MITLVAPDSGCLVALEGALDRLGFAHLQAARPDQAAPDGPVLLTGAGPLDPARARLQDTGWWRELPQVAANGRAVLALNLGLHLLAEGSEESPRGAGLGLIPGIARRLGPGVRVPHRGWSSCRLLGPHPLLADLVGGWLYFAHCHALEPAAGTLGVAVHGWPFSMLECRGRVVGVQARLERSGALGLTFLERLLAALGERPQAPAAFN